MCLFIIPTSTLKDTSHSMMVKQSTLMCAMDKRGKRPTTWSALATVSPDKAPMEAVVAVAAAEEEAGALVETEVTVVEVGVVAAAASPVVRWDTCPASVPRAVVVVVVTVVVEVEAATVVVAVVVVVVVEGAVASAVANLDTWPASALRVVVVVEAAAMVVVVVAAAIKSPKMPSFLIPLPTFLCPHLSPLAFPLPSSLSSAFLSDACHFTA